MQTTQTDTQIRAGLRSILTRHHVDTNKTTLCCARGVVRMLGELHRHGAYSGTPVELGEMEALEQEIQSLKGVVRVHFDLINWRKLSNGQWQPKESAHSARARDRSEELTSVEGW